MNGTRRLVLVGGLGFTFGQIAEAKSRKSSKRRKAAKRRKKRRKAAHAVDYDALLSNLAGQMRYGLRDDQLSLDELEGKLARGETVECQCSYQAWLAVRAVRRAGGRARMVGTFMYPYFEGPNTGHILMEARIGGRWQCYDMMCNVQAVDANGNGCSLEEWCASPDPRWRRIADDEAVYPREEHLKAIYDRLLGTPLIILKEAPLDAILYEPDTEDAARIMATYSWIRLVSKKRWKKEMA
jgi:hypothetical protein